MAEKPAAVFQPAWWCRNRHAQTIWRKFFGRDHAIPHKRERWVTPDDDFLDLDFFELERDSEDSPLVLLLHGFEGSSQASYILGMAGALRTQGFRVVALNFRSCSGEMNHSLTFYHSGDTQDLDHVIKKLKNRWPTAPFFAVGFSLGGNVLLKWLGEQGAAVQKTLRAAVAISVPFDLGVAARRLDRAYGGLYGRNFLISLKEKLIQKEALFPGQIDCKLVRKTNSYLQFEDRLFAPLHGFRDAEDYWRQSSAQYFVADIAFPTLILHAEDDPFIPGRHLPHDVFSASKWINAEVSTKGGHVGFVEGSWPGSVRYFAEHRSLQYFSNFINA